MCWQPWHEPAWGPRGLVLVASRVLAWVTAALAVAVLGELG